MKNEIFKNIPGFEGLYEASNLGNIRNFKTKHILSPGLSSRGYNIVVLYKKGEKRITKTVHRLVMLAFKKNKNNYPQINHINRIRTDNRLENLEWCTASENVIHSYVCRGLNKKIY